MTSSNSPGYRRRIGANRWETRLADLQATRNGISMTSETGVAAVGTAGGFTALLSAAACCVLPLAFALVGMGSGGLAILVPYHWPLTIGAGLLAAAGWAFYARKRRACARSDDCGAAPPRRPTFVLLCVATVSVILFALWPGFIEVPLMRLLEGA